MSNGNNTTPISTCRLTATSIRLLGVVGGGVSFISATGNESEKFLRKKQ